MMRDEDRSTPHTRAVSRTLAGLGSLPALLIAFFVVIAWTVGGVFLAGRFAEGDYLLVVDTVTSLVTFLMVFVIQNSQNREGRAIQAKLDAQSAILEHVAERLDIDHDGLLTGLVGVEDAPERTIRVHQESVRRAARD